MQYGCNVKALAVYLSMFQLAPYKRTQVQFAEAYQIFLSAGTLFNFNREAYERMRPFLKLCKRQFTQGKTINADETSINVAAQRIWLHFTSNDYWTMIAPHAKRGKEAMDTIGILPLFIDFLLHDHCKPYYQSLSCVHVLCNAHHKRELIRAYEQDGQPWAKGMEDLLDKINITVREARGCLPENQTKQWRHNYRAILKEAESECPPPVQELIQKRKQQ